MAIIVFVHKPDNKKRKIEFVPNISKGIKYFFNPFISIKYVKKERDNAPKPAVKRT